VFIFQKRGPFVVEVGEAKLVVPWWLPKRIVHWLIGKIMVIETKAGPGALYKRVHRDSRLGKDLFFEKEKQNGKQNG
jgi:hypothetical protein